MKRVYRRRRLLPYQQAMGASEPTKASRVEINLKMVFDDVEDFGERHQPMSPEHRLVVEVLAAACRDFLGAAYVPDDERESARAWLFDGDVGMEPFTFETACSVLRIDPDRGRADILAQRERRMVG